MDEEEIDNCISECLWEEDDYDYCEQRCREEAGLEEDWDEWSEDWEDEDWDEEEW